MSRPRVKKMHNIAQVYELDENVYLTPAQQATLRSTRLKDKPSIFSDRAVGIEVEIEKVNATFEIDHDIMYCETDGSLKDGGLEIISRPINGNNVDAFLARLSKMLNKDQPQTVFSHRCSVHVHVNVRDFTRDEIRALVATYLCLEDLFFEEVQDFRRNSVYCVPLNDFNVDPNMMFTSGFTHHTKYAALNIGPMCNYGTVEFRHHGGTKDMNELMKWIFMCQSFVDSIKTIGYDRLRQLIMQINTVSNYGELILNIWGRNHPWINKDLGSYISSNIVLAKKVIR